MFDEWTYSWRSRSSTPEVEFLGSQLAKGVEDRALDYSTEELRKYSRISVRNVLIEQDIMDTNESVSLNVALLWMLRVHFLDISPTDQRTEALEKLIEDTVISALIAIV